MPEAESSRRESSPDAQAGDDADRFGWRNEGRDLLRAIAAGSIVGVPLIYTMEMWWHGRTIPEWQLVLILATTLLANFAFNLFSGFRGESSAMDALFEAITATALGMLYSFGLLCLIGEITFRAAWSDILGRVLIEAVPVSLGISVANSQVRGKSRNGDEEASDKGSDGPEQRQLKQDLTDLAATMTGATIFAFNVAPTEEIIQIAARLAAWQHVVLMAASLLLCYMILFAAGFQKRKVYVPSIFQSPLVESTMAYAVSLGAAAMLLYLIGVPEATGHTSIFAKSTVALGLPAVVGASAGRLIT